MQVMRMTTIVATDAVGESPQLAIGHRSRVTGLAREASQHILGCLESASINSSRPTNARYVGAS